MAFASPSSIAFQMGQIVVYWYGVCMAFAIFCGLFFSSYILKKYHKNIDIERFYDLVFYVILGGILGARLYYVLCDFSYFYTHLTEIFMFWHGGLSIHGAILGGILSGSFYMKQKKMNFLLFADIIVLGVCLGQIIGRMGNFFNSEAFGSPTNLPWKLFIPLANRPLGYENFLYFHPTFLYEMILNSGILLCLFAIGRYFNFKKNGVLFFSYLLLYSIVRIFIENIRIDSILDIQGVPIAIIMSCALGMVGFFGLFFVLYSKK